MNKNDQFQPAGGIEGGTDWNGVETPHDADSMQPFDTTVLNSKKWQEAAHDGNRPQKAFQHHSGGQGIRQHTRKSLSDNGLEQSAQSHVVKYVVVSDNLENKHLSDVISAWSLLPPDIQQAVLLLVRQYVK